MATLPKVLINLPIPNRGGVAPRVRTHDDRLDSALAQYRSLFPIVHLRSQKGLSRARNEALAFAQGEILCFPDDDC
jgi:Glycosyl transferase family 2